VKKEEQQLQSGINKDIMHIKNEN